MRKKVLLLTTIYPAPDLKYGTSAIHYFTKEWVKLGYEVKVIHHQAVYPAFLYFFARFFRELIASKTGAVVFTNPEQGIKNYQMDGVSVHRCAMFKWIPHGKYSRKVIENQISNITELLKADDFVPEIIIGHFSNPQLEIIYRLKKLFASRTCMIMHDVGSSIISVYGKKYSKFMSSVDVWGFRSMPIKVGFEAIFGIQKFSFFCYSGIPEKYISQTSNRKFPEDLSRFVYIGDFIKRKYPIALIYAVDEVYPTKKYHITYVGKGAEEKNIRKEIDSRGISINVTFTGQIPRDEVRQALDDAECMIMISKIEAFGLVYLEAMGRGCITIGSRNEGIDGIIKHGENGFLCEAGNHQELATIIKYINSLTSLEREQISKNAISTALQLTDFKVAKEYIQAVDNQ